MHDGHGSPAVVDQGFAQHFPGEPASESVPSPPEIMQSSEQRLRDLWKATPRTVITIDPVDADNFPMAALAARAETSNCNRLAPIAVVLMRRAVNFGWANWKTTEDPCNPGSSMFQRFFDKLVNYEQKLMSEREGLTPEATEARIQETKKRVTRRLIQTPTEADDEWINAVFDEDERRWFLHTREAGHDSAHSDVYIAVSATRLYGFMASYVKPQRWKAFAQAEKEDIVAAIYGPRHVHDWSLALDRQAVKEIAKHFKQHPAFFFPYSEARGQLIAQTLREFITRWRWNHDPENTHQVLMPGLTEAGLHQWFSWVLPKTEREYKYLVGGPMTVVYDHLQEREGSIKVCVSQLGSFSPASNLLPKQFNQAIDDKAAIECMNTAQSGYCPIWLVPTELAKNEYWNFPSGEGNRLEETFGRESALTKLANQFSNATGTAPVLFDVVTALAAYEPHLLPPADTAFYTVESETGRTNFHPADDPDFKQTSKSELHVFGLRLVKQPVEAHGKEALPNLDELLAWLRDHAEPMRKRLHWFLEPKMTQRSLLKPFEDYARAP